MITKRFIYTTFISAVIFIFLIGFLNLKRYKELNLEEKIEVYLDGCIMTGLGEYCLPDFIYEIKIEESFEKNKDFNYVLFFEHTNFNDLSRQKKIINLLEMLNRLKKISEYDIERMVKDKYIPIYLKQKIKSIKIK